MHALHIILLQSDRDLEPDEVFTLASDAIESFQDEVFDWHAEGPGRWTQEYPAPISFRKSPDGFMSELRAIVERMKAERQGALEYLARQLGLEDDCTSETIGRALFGNVESLGEHALWSAIRYLQLMRGDYTPDSGFYDAIQGSASIPVPEQVANEPLGETEDLYLVPMDLHY
ncbi:hypothetical protein EVC37_16180 [Methylocaldum sp. BRCS4]|jgi:hypothetical protein|uniref:hypothetical protein n=1 Tax=Methylocaldum sp. 14B TaxID=1912213 RepID=UPI000989DC10|nr:hypothetical protein [Methylocaldum sp. 14B]MVF23140.1 hypothetical protein [Methylocaldum sp. BRCS4]